MDISRLKLRGQQRWHKKASRDFDWLSKFSRSSTLERSGPDPSERLELTPRPPSQNPAMDAPWNCPRGSELKRTRSKGFRLRSAQSRQYRNPRGQLRLAKKQGAKVDRGLEEQTDRFGKGRQEIFKRNPIRLKPVSRHPIRLLRSEAKRQFHHQVQKLSRDQKRMRKQKPGLWLDAGCEDQLHLDSRCTVVLKS